MQRINIDDKEKDLIINEFKKFLDNTKFTENHINFSMPLNKTIPNITRPRVFIDLKAYAKMMIYVRDTSTEIAWHGTVERDIKANAYLIKDVFLYPQTISSTTVQTDQDKYNTWLEQLDDDTFNTMRFQGHSHVNFATTPSGTDTSYYKDMLNILPKNDYYIFMILNKTGSMSLFIYDLATNIIYETTDIDIIVYDLENKKDIIKSITEEKTKNCTQQTYNYISPGKAFSVYDDNDYYDYNKRYCDRIYSEETDVNDLIDDINNKYKQYKNPTLSTNKNKKKKLK